LRELETDSPRCANAAVGFFAQALKWIDAQRAAKAPFFACIPLNAAHGPHVVPEAFASP
jgi:hypothetical protein